jgi:hypothetical protein
VAVLLGNSGARPAIVAKKQHTKRHPAQQRRKIDDFAVLFGCSKAGMVGASSLGVGGHAESTT